MKEYSYVKIEAKSFGDLMTKLGQLEKENAALKQTIAELQKQVIDSDKLYFLIHGNRR